MGLDGGTIVTRTDVLRGSSWRLANQDDGRQRSTRGGQLTATGALLRDAAADRDAAYNRWSCCALSGRSPSRPARTSSLTSSANCSSATPSSSS